MKTSFVSYFPFLPIDSRIYFYVTADNTIVKYQECIYFQRWEEWGRYKELNVKDLWDSL